MFVRIVLVVCLVAASATGTPFIIRSKATAASPEIAAVYPNPVTDEDVGEFVVVSFPRPTNISTWSLSDGENVVRLPNGTVPAELRSLPPRTPRRITLTSVRFRFEISR
ncbi:hypothetical protein [Haladaptatus sp. DFWS20]|uniref:hypothetical protein n=1 Tax=Haladaptatus sp. DFWS20 TaxID=3403467 RepID=UPI003EBDE795